MKVKVSKNQKKTVCGSILPTKRLTLTDLVNDYIKPGGKREWRRAYEQCLTLKKGAPVNTLNLPNDIVTICTYGLHFDYKRNLFVPMEGHQRRIAGTLPEIIIELNHRNVLSMKFKSFEELFDFITDVANTVRTKHTNLKFGQLANFDLAYRFAAAIPVPMPQDFVYFQAGAFDGIKNLFMNAKMPLPPKARKGVANYTIPYKDLISIPQFAPLANLTAGEIEDFCCINSTMLLTITLP